MIRKAYNQIGEAGFLFASTVLVNLGNYAINLLLGRFLGPQEFAEANILATLVLVLSFTALGFQLTVAKYTAAFNAKDETLNLHGFMQWIRRKGKLFSLITVAFLLLGIAFIRTYLNMQNYAPLFILFIGIPLYIQMSISRGYFQGVGKFKKLAYTYLAEMLGRLVFTVCLVYFVLQSGANWVSEAVAIGFLASFIFSFLVGRLPKLAKLAGRGNFSYRPVVQFMLIIGLYEFSQILINNSDVILVKHFFENFEAGLYASLALIGRVVYFATWTIVTLLFPKVIEKDKKGEKHIHLFWISLIIVGTIGSSIVLACFLFDNFIIQLLFGEAYLSIASLLWKYAVATTLFSCANVFVYYHMSLNRYTPVFISLLVGCLQIISLYLYHDSIEQVILVQIILMSALLSTLSIFHLFSTPKKSNKINIQRELKIEEYA